MKFRISMMALGATLLIAPAAFAQDTPAQTAPAPAAPAGPATVSDAEVAQFVTAALAIDKINKDTTVAATDKNTKMAEAVTTSGLTPARFNEISQAMQADPSLNQRIQKAAAAQQPAAPAAGAAAPAPTPHH